jgi:mRNA interferase MazF
MARDEHLPPPRVPPRIKAAPRIRQVYWCRLPVDAELPELWKVRPVIILSYRNTLRGTVTVIPTTTVPQDENPWAYKLTISLDRSEVSWAICDKPLTVAVSRLHPNRTIPRLSEDEFQEIIRKLLHWLPKLTLT